MNTNQVQFHKKECFCTVPYFSTFLYQDTSIDVQGLYDNHQYLFRVAAINENGTGDFLVNESPIIAKMPFGKLCVYKE